MLLRVSTYQNYPICFGKNVFCF